jgi:hypothetical protein
VALRGLAALLFLGGIVYALVSGKWEIGATTFPKIPNVWKS